jgi:hypothetical protein
VRTRKQGQNTPRRNPNIYRADKLAGSWARQLWKTMLPNARQRTFVFEKNEIKRKSTDIAG